MFADSSIPAADVADEQQSPAPPGAAATSTTASSSPATESSPSFTVHSSFSELVPLYDAFILDQFGVMHDGQSSLPGAAECVASLATEHGKRLVILSNTSSSAEATMAKLPRLGFDPKHVLGAVTSGEEASRHVAETYGDAGGDDEGDDGNKKKRKKMLWITWSEGRTPAAVLDDFLGKCGDVVVTPNVEDADFVLAHGAEVIRDADGVETSIGNFHHDEDYSVLDPILRRAAERNLPMVCANPDFVMVRPDGKTRANMPGKIARRYEDRWGGKCSYFGKPHVAHFEACLRELGAADGSMRVAHVGDSLHHDVAGANATAAAGGGGRVLDSIFVAGGIHREEIGCALGEVPDREALVRVFEAEGGHVPTRVVHMLRM